MPTQGNPNACQYCRRRGWVMRLNYAGYEPLLICDRCATTLQELWRAVEEGVCTDFYGLHTKSAQCRKPPVFSPVRDV